MLSSILFPLLWNVAISPLASAQASGSSSNDGEKIARVVEISGAFFDLPPLSSPIIKLPAPQFDLSVVLSFLPKINSALTNDKAPGFHGIPMIGISSQIVDLEENNLWPLGGTISTRNWFGTLIPGMAHLVDLDGSPSQWLLGTLLGWGREGTTMGQSLQLGIQHAKTKVSGIQHPIPSSLAVNSTLIFLSGDVAITALNSWVGATIAHKTTSVLIETSRGPLFSLTDELKGVRIPFVLEAHAGVTVPSWNTRIALSEVWVPERLIMPRAMFSILL